MKKIMIIGAGRADLAAMGGKIYLHQMRIDLGKEMDDVRNANVKNFPQIDHESP